MPAVSEQAWRDFSANATSLEVARESIHAQYLNKWIGVYKGQIEAVADSFAGVTEISITKHIPTTDSLVRFIGQKEMTLIL